MLVAVYSSMVGGLAFVVRRRRQRSTVILPEGVPWQDLALLAVATHRLSPLVTKHSVTAVVRAPFTRFREPVGDGEVTEGVRGTGGRHAVRELMTCPFCIAQWIATALRSGCRSSAGQSHFRPMTVVTFEAVR